MNTFAQSALSAWQLVVSVDPVLLAIVGRSLAVSASACAIEPLARQALRKALMGALASPLKLLGMGTADGKVTNLAPQPVEFLPGSVELPADSAARVDQLAHEDTATLVGRFGARSRARAGEKAEVAVDTRALHFFDPETGLGIYEEEEKGEGS